MKNPNDACGSKQDEKCSNQQGGSRAVIALSHDLWSLPKAERYQQRSGRTVTQICPIAILVHAATPVAHVISLPVVPSRRAPEWKKRGEHIVHSDSDQQKAGQALQQYFKCVHAPNYPMIFGQTTIFSTSPLTKDKERYLC